MIDHSADEHYIRYLEIGYYAVGVVNLLYCFFLAALVMLSWFPGAEQASPWFTLVIMSAIFAFMLLFYLGLAIMSLLAGRWVSARRWRTGCVVAAALNCMNPPLGMGFGVSAIVLLQREGVKRLFQPRAPEAA